MANRDEDRTGMQVDPYGNQVQVDIIQITDSHVDEFKAGQDGQEREARLQPAAVRREPRHVGGGEGAACEGSAAGRSLPTSSTHGGPCDACKSHNAAVKASWRRAVEWNGRVQPRRRVCSERGSDRRILLCFVVVLMR